MTAAHFVRVSGNHKLGPIPAGHTSPSTCPPDCALFDACYGRRGRVQLTWRRVDSEGIPWDEFCAHVRALPRGQLWRVSVAGDLPGRGNRINAGELRALIQANKGRAGFGFSHKRLTPANVRFIREANRGGLVINVSADGPADADRKLAHRLPVVTVMPSAGWRKARTPAGVPIVPCPAQRRPDVQCINCGNGSPLCRRASRKFVVGFDPLNKAAARAAAANSGDTHE